MVKKCVEKTGIKLNFKTHFSRKESIEWYR